MLQKIREAKENESGFTLIELLIVIVILGVLAGIVVFSVSGVNNNSKDAACKTELRTIETAGEAYIAQVGTPAPTVAALAPKFLHTAPAAADGITYTPDNPNNTFTVTSTNC